MKKFTFKLEPLLKMRLKREELVTIELAAAQNEKAKIENSIENVKTGIKDSIERSRNYFNAGVKIDSLLMTRNYIEVLKKRLAGFETDLAAAENKISLIKQKLAEAVKERKIIETLKENQFTAYKKEYNRQDNSQMDEIANNKTHPEPENNE